MHTHRHRVREHTCTHTLQVDTEATVLAFKQKIAEKAGVAPELQRLIYKGRVMKEDQNTLASYSELVRGHRLFEGWMFGWGNQ